VNVEPRNLKYNKFAGGKYKGRDTDDPRHVFANGLNIEYHCVSRPYCGTIFLPSPQLPPQCTQRAPRDRKLAWMNHGLSL